MSQIDMLLNALAIALGKPVLFGLAGIALMGLTKWGFNKLKY
ncbi:hypothetical protein [Bacillus cereus]|nr:hypothetical protein [Bacillus cereus]